MKSGASSGYKILMNGKKRNSIKVTISQFDAEKSVKIENRILWSLFDIFRWEELTKDGTTQESGLSEEIPYSLDEIRVG